MYQNYLAVWLMETPMNLLLLMQKKLLHIGSKLRKNLGIQFQSQKGIDLLMHS